MIAKFWFLWVAGFAAVLMMHKYYIPQIEAMGDLQMDNRTHVIAIAIVIFISWPLIAIALIFMDKEL
jgi:hypothetical protein